MNAKALLQDILRDPEKHNSETLFALFDALPEASADFMLGEWTGGVFFSGHPGEQQLSALQWVGKNFNSANDVNPIVVSGSDGERVVSEVMGQASLREVRYRDRMSATMIYDTSPTMDYFRTVDHDTVMGVMDHKGDRQPLFFYLQRL